MKYIKGFILALLAFSFTGCLDINEKIEIKKDGSGNYALNMDMSQMIELLKTYMGQDELAQKGMDTTIYMKSLVDTMNSLSADKKDLLRPGTVHVKLNVDEKVFVANLLFPYTSQANLQKLYTTMSDGSLGTTQLLKGVSPGGQEEMPGGGSGGDINQFNGIYDFVCHDGFISKKLNKDKLKELQANPQVEQLKQAGAMGVEILYTTTLQLPRPVVKIDNPLAKLSPDRKTVTLKYNILDLFDKPDQFGFTVTY